MHPPPDLALYFVTDTGLCRPRPVADVVRAAVAGGARTVQVRDKDAGRRELLELTRAVLGAVAGVPGVTVVVNDAVDVALITGADGVHVGQDDLPVTEVRRLMGPDRLVGLSVSSPAELDVALALPEGTVDLVGIGPFRGTPTKPDAGLPLGPGGVAELAAAARAAGLATVAIGGIDAANAAEVAATGVDGICVVSALCTAEDPAATARTLRAAFESGRARVAAP